MGIGDAVVFGNINTVPGDRRAGCGDGVSTVILDTFDDQAGDFISGTKAAFGVGGCKLLLAVVGKFSVVDRNCQVAFPDGEDGVGVVKGDIIVFVVVSEGSLIDGISTPVFTFDAGKTAAQRFLPHKFVMGVSQLRILFAVGFGSGMNGNGDSLGGDLAGGIHGDGVGGKCVIGIQADKAAEGGGGDFCDVGTVEDGA